MYAASASGSYVTRISASCPSPTPETTVHGAQRPCRICRRSVVPAHDARADPRRARMARSNEMARGCVAGLLLSRLELEVPIRIIWRLARADWDRPRLPELSASNVVPVPPFRQAGRWVRKRKPRTRFVAAAIASRNDRYWIRISVHVLSLPLCRPTRVVRRGDWFPIPDDCATAPRASAAQRPCRICPRLALRHSVPVMPR
jgi:hypothetical protein